MDSSQFALQPVAGSHSYRGDAGFWLRELKVRNLTASAEDNPGRALRRERG